MTKLSLVSLCLFALLVATGCAAPNRLALDADVDVSPSLTPDELDAVMGGLDAWKAATGGKVRFSVRIGECDGCNYEITTGVASDQGAVAYTDTDVGYARTVLDLPAVRVDAKTCKVSYELRLQDVMAHEAGHALGLSEHEAGTLMRPGGFGGAKVDARTLARFEAL